MASYNHRAILKVAVLVTVMTIAIVLRFPLAHAWYEWVSDVYRFSQDPVFAASYSPSAKLFYAIFPLMFLVFGMLWYVLVMGQHRKTYYSCGWPQGTVMWVFNKPGKARGHIYDLFSVLHGFKEIPWEAIPRPWTGTFFDGKTVVYWRSSVFQGPSSWNKDIVTNPDRNFRDALLTTFTLADRRISQHHRFNPKCDYNLLTSDELYSTTSKSLETAIAREKALNYQITEDVQRLARANPDVANDMAHRDIPIPRGTRDKLIAAQEALNEKPKKVPDGAHASPSDAK
jgi:hypothetical protein